MRPFLSTSVVLAALFAVPVEAQHNAFDCRASEHGPDCRVQLKSGQDSAVVQIRPTDPLLTVAGQTIDYYVQPGRGFATTLVKSDDKHRATLVWRGTSPTSEPITVLVQANAGGVLLRDTIHLLPPPTSQLASNPRLLNVWFGDSWIPHTIQAEVVTGPSGMSEASCERTRYTFQARGGGKAEPDTSTARWEPTTADNSAGRCFAETRWKLGDVGPQQLRLTLADGQQGTRSQLIEGYARQAPRLVGGIGFFTRFVGNQDFYCEPGERDREVCAERPVGPDTIKRGFRTKMENEWKPFFGVEFPIMYTSQPTSPFARFINTRTRLLAGSTFEEPARNGILGLTILPILKPANERVVLQVQAGWRPLAGGWFGGVSLDAGSLLSNALKAFGAPL
jgi:hypothetical protein